MSLPTFFLAFILLFAACGNSKNHTSEDNTGKNVAQESTQAKQDTVPTPTPPGPGLAPGQAKITGTIVEIEENKHLTIRVLVNTVEEYGSSTRPIVSSDTLTVQAANLSEDNISKLKPSQKITATIQQNIPSGNSADHFWSMIKLEN